ncbi:DUF6582 domain-containing protein [Sideroxydans lithotrophicus]|uniref:Uncharacterized protein n=1 Tax=Sideroxydans lithotrophicus (strain ES-1) TaxID=580332 RepID=D5CT59_SIDLE|nr:DUF6582 domain-containing protein [Sideroxydans lithotrophicus]ADE12145.1 conserved hypothetical protein [Sideroxydans lithotrophicus ES-1]
MALTKEQREELKDSDFAVPGKRVLPIHDEAHVKMAWSMLPKTQDLTDDERSEARRRIIRRAHDLDINTTKWEVHATSFTFEAMALDMPTGEHPNKMPFKGVMTRLDQTSDAPPHGSSGKQTYIPTDVAEAAIPSLLGMAVDYKPDFDGHDKKAKIGLITEAYIEGDALWIAGFFYANDFPDECQRIRAEKSRLGWSYECQAAIRDVEADPWVVDYCIFTGAALLYKELAAYTTTSLEATAQTDTSDTEIVMTIEELKKLLDPLSASIAAIGKEVTELKAAKTTNASVDAAGVTHIVKPHADVLRACADGMEAAGIGLHATQGHVKVLRHMAARMEAEAAMGKLPHVYRDHDFFSTDAAAASAASAAETSGLTKQLETITASVADLGTKLTDLQAKAFTNAAAPERKTLSPEIKSLLAKAGIGEDVAAEGKVTTEMVDKFLDAAGIKGTKAIETKLKLREAGVMPAGRK